MPLMDQLAERGYVHVRGAVPAESARAAGHETADRLAASLEADRGDADDHAVDSDTEELQRAAQRLSGNALRGPALHRLMFSPELVGLAEQALGAERVMSSGSYCVRTKPPTNERFNLEWHQDAAYFETGSELTPAITAWLPLRTLPSSAALEVWTASNRQGLLPHYFAERAGPRLRITPGALPALVPSEVIIAEPGDVVLFLNTTVHRSVANRTPRTAITADFRYVAEGSSNFYPPDPLFATKPPPTLDDFTALFRSHQGPDRLDRSWPSERLSRRGRQ